MQSISLSSFIENNEDCSVITTSSTALRVKIKTPFLNGIVDSNVEEYSEYIIFKSKLINFIK